VFNSHVTSPSEGLVGAKSGDSLACGVSNSSSSLFGRSPTGEKSLFDVPPNNANNLAVDGDWRTFSILLRKYAGEFSLFAISFKGLYVRESSNMSSLSSSMPGNIIHQDCQHKFSFFGDNVVEQSRRKIICDGH
jgi:hypothetical protein